MRRSFFILLALSVTTLTAILAGCVSPRRDVETEVRDSIDGALGAYREGNARAASGYLDGAIRTLVNAGQGRTRAHVLVASRLEEQGRPADAVNFLQAALKDREMAWDPMLWATLAEGFTKIGDTARAKEAEAEAESRAARIVDGTGIEAHARGARKYPEGERFLQAGWFYHERRDLARALLAWRRAVAAEPKNPEYLNMLGYTLADEGTTRAEWEEALELTGAAMRLMPDNALIVDSYGWALYRLGDLKGARRYLREAVDGMPGQAELRYHLGMVYADMGLTRDSENELTRALRLKPDFAPAKKAMEALKQRPDFSGAVSAP